MRIRMRREINELIMIWVSSIVKVPLINSLATEAKLIQVISTTTKHADKSFLSQVESFFPCFSLCVEGWLWIGWVVSFDGFDCCFLFVVGGAGNKLGSTLPPLFSHLSKPTPNLYVNLVALSSSRLKFSSIIFSLKMVFSRRAVK
jgi:hypothetical protein